MGLSALTRSEQPVSLGTAFKIINKYFETFAHMRNISNEYMFNLVIGAFFKLNK